MKAVVISRYGSPEVLELRDVERPAPKRGEILIRVHAAVVGPSDCAFRKGEPFIVKLMFGLRSPKYPIGGNEFAGEVAAVGEGVTGFAVGDEVFGLSPNTFGAHGEYMCLPETAPVAKKSAAMTFEEAAAVADGGLTAITFLRDKAGVRRDQKVLINGASGAVGAYSVQLAKHYGAHVTGVCSGANVELVTSLGADRVIDYTSEDFTQSGETYDIIFDAVGKSSFARCKGVLSPSGIYLTTGPSLNILLQMARTGLGRGKKAVFTAAGLQQSKENLALLNELFENGQIRAVIDRRYPLEQLADAHRYVDTERKRGNVIINVVA